MIEIFPKLVDLVAYTQIFSALVIAYTVIVYVRQARAIELQARLQQKHTSNLQFVEVIRSLLDMRQDVERILLLHGKPLDNWTKEDNESAIKVCGQFHFIGVLIHEGLIPGKLVAETWFCSISKCHKILQPFLIKMRQERDPRYWTGFDFLAKQVADIEDNFKGFH